MLSATDASIKRPPVGSTLFRSYACAIPQTFAPFAPPAPAADGGFWKRLPSNLRGELRSQGAQALALVAERGWQPLTATLYMDFSLTGNRVRFEDAYFGRRNLLSVLTLAACAAENDHQKDAFLREAVNGIILVCEESGWQLPAHNSAKRDGAQLPLADTTAPVLDLFACETGAQLALIQYLLHDELTDISPLICQRIAYELERRVLRPYREQHFWWQGDGDEPMCNWTPWCTQNVLLTAFLLPRSDEERRAIVRKALYSSDCFLKDYGDDGCCSEGPEYYRHAGLCLYNVIDLLSVVTGGALEPLFHEPRIKNMAEYIVQMHVPESDYYFNFADASAVAGRAGAREFLFGRRIGSERLCAFAATDWQRSSPQERLLALSARSKSGCNPYYVLQALAVAADIDAYHAPALEQRTHIWYESVGIFIVHTPHLSVAAKAGCNADSHNHNDTGSFIVYKDSQPFIIDIGVESYTKQTFSANRYDIWTMQSAWHNLPTFSTPTSGAVMQKDGAHYRATDVHVGEQDISMDIAEAYPPEAGLASYRRMLTVDGAVVRVHDSCRFADGVSHPVTLSLLLCKKPAVTYRSVKDASEATLTVAALGTITLSSPQRVTIAVEHVPVTDARLRRAWNELYRALVTFHDELTLSLR